jgi:2-keto-4-pentenoate hydratase/2-oxohepta-3-ene-1,7-dioic acid hydratase in catechol pathway
MSSTTTPKRNNFDDVARLNARIANLRIYDEVSLGIESDGGVIDVKATAAALGLSVPRDMDDLLQNGLGAQLCDLMMAVDKNKKAAVLVAAEKVAFAPVVLRPEKILCVGFNYKEHAEETNTPIPKSPPLFCKFWNCLNHHGGTIKLPTRIDDRFDYETELVIVFGRECKDVSEADALDYVAGYATGNDFSARKMQTATTQFLAGKVSDGFAPLGPWLVTRDRVPDPNKLKLKTFVNGQKRQDWTTEDMIFNCRKLIAFVTSIMTIKPGDILFTGTPQGVIFGEKAPPEQRQWLKAGDEVVSQIEGLGELRVRLI